MEEHRTHTAQIDRIVLRSFERYSFFLTVQANFLVKTQISTILSIFVASRNGNGVFEIFLYLEIVRRALSIFIDSPMIDNIRRDECSFESVGRFEFCSRQSDLSDLYFSRSYSIEFAIMLIIFNEIIATHCAHDVPLFSFIDFI